MTKGSDRLLARGGYDPDEEFIVTPHLACGGAVFKYMVNCGDYPSEEDMPSIVDDANYTLRKHNIAELVTRELLDEIIKTDFKPRDS